MSNLRLVYAQDSIEIFIDGQDQQHFKMVLVQYDVYKVR